MVLLKNKLSKDFVLLFMKRDGDFQCLSFLQQTSRCYKETESFCLEDKISSFYLCFKLAGFC